MNISVGKLLAQIFALFALFALILFLPAGTIKWAAGWTFLALFFLGTIALSFWLLKHDPELLHERMTGLGKADQKHWDKVIITIAGIFFILWLALMPLDAVRFHWSHVPVWGQASGLVIILFSFYLFYLVFRENPYLSPAVRIQQERGQRVISTGPYSHVRHPMYSAFIVLLVGICLLLGSLYGLLGGLILAVIIIKRALLEEATLMQELPGYDAYMAQVHYRLIPRLW